MRRSVLDQKWAGYVVAALSVLGLTLVLKVIESGAGGKGTRVVFTLSITVPSAVALGRIPVEK